MEIAFYVYSMMCISLTLAYENEVCNFNRLCTCRRSHHEVLCRGIPFHEFPSSIPADVYQVTIIRSGLQYLDNNIFQESNVASLHLMQNHIIHISPETFGGLDNILTTLDLSHNKLIEFPSVALHRLNNLQWLNIYGNRIHTLHTARWSHMNSKHTLQSLFLGANHIKCIPEGAFVQLTNLNLLDLEGNLINDVGIYPFPSSLTSLSLSNNILRKVPLHAIYYLKSLNSLYLSGNLIKKLPSPFHLYVKKLEKLEISNNLLVEFPETVFNGSFTIKELHLEFNFIRKLSARSFRHTKTERLVLANNRINSVHSDAFVGIEKSLVSLDLSYNLIEIFPSAVNDLKSLAFLSLKSNLLRSMDKSDLHGSRGSLEVLDLSGNMFITVPKQTLRSLTKIVRLSLQDNRIHKIYNDDFHGWGKTLVTLSLANNRMNHLPVDSFFHLTKLKELKLSFNNLKHLDQNIFLPMKKTLEFLDVSSAFYDLKHPLDVVLRDMEKVEWCQLDHNNISTLSAPTLPKLRHLDLSNNDIELFPDNFFSSKNYKYLTAINVVSNKLKVLKTNTFANLTHLASVVLFGNKISSIEWKAFQNCPFLHTVVFSKNNLSIISPSAFYNLSSLSNIFLQDNQLEVLSLDFIDGETSLLYINVSNNAIRHLEVNNSTFENILKVRTLDITDNKILKINSSYFSPMSEHLINLFFSRNELLEIDLPTLSVLQVLELSYNNLSNVDITFYLCCPNIQIIKLDHNFIQNISDTFKGSMFLRILDLSHNKLDFLSEDAFVGTKLERLNISENGFHEIPISSLLPVHDTIKHVDLSFNRIRNLPANGFSGLEKLKALNLSSNEISVLHKTSFYGLDKLIELDLSHNSLRYIADEITFSYLVGLRFLHMRNTSLVTMCPLPLSFLNVLILKDNFLFNISETVFKVAHHVQQLDLSGNLLQDVPHHTWSNTKLLVELDISGNPIDVLGANSFSGLQNLQKLDISGLQLKRLDPRALQGLRYMTTLKTNSYASVRSFRLQDLLSQSPAVRKVTVCVEESTLSHQVQRAFGTKLRELVITGHNLQRILPDAFAGLSTHELTIRISGTTISQFPNGLLKYLPDIRYLTLDLRNNQLVTMGRGVLAAITRDGPDDTQTQHISGGVLLEENPWSCNCNLLWLGQWLRRWLRETFHVHMLSAEAALYVNTVSRNAKCYWPIRNVTYSILDLRSSDLQCDRTQTNNIASVVPKYGTVLLLSLINLLLCSKILFFYAGN